MKSRERERERVRRKKPRTEVYKSIRENINSFFIYHLNRAKKVNNRKRWLERIRWYKTLCSLTPNHTGGCWGPSRPSATFNEHIFLFLLYVYFSEKQSSRYLVYWNVKQTFYPRINQSPVVGTLDNDPFGCHRYGPIGCQGFPNKVGYICKFWAARVVEG